MDSNFPDKEMKKDGFIGQRMTYLPGIIKKRVLKDPRVKDIFITHIGIFPKAKGHLRVRPLGSSQYILLYCVDGEGWVKVGGKHHILSKHQFFIINEKTPCSYGSNNSNPWTNYWIHYTGANAKYFSPAVNRIIDVSPAENSRLDERLLLFEEMLQNINDYFVFEKVVYANICLKHFLTSIKYLDVYRSIKKETGNDLLENVISFMKNNINKNLKIDTIAEKFNCSSSNIYKLFKKNLHSTPLDFFIHLKMERACRLLTNTNMRVKEVGRKLGYEDQYYFSRIFSKHIGLSPAKYRKEER